MESRIPLPTDNVYKFYALFGLLLFFFGFSVLLYSIKSANEFWATAYVEMADLKSRPSLTPVEVAKKQILERQAEVVQSDKKFFEWVSALIITAGVLGMGVGFSRWHLTYQRDVDLLAQLQAEKIRWEIKSLKRRRPTR